MIINDLPILNKSQDLLDRNRFASNIADTIMSINAENGFCISIQGPWGSGKSSVLNLIADDINENYIKNSDDPDNNPKIIYFSPWNYVTTEDLFKQFFYILADAFSDPKIKRDLEISKAIKDYIEKIESLHPVLKVASFLSTVLVKSVSRRNPYDSYNIIKQSDLIVELLRDQKRKIIVIIDDLDRLTNEEIRLVIQLVNSVAKFPNVIFLLAYDKKVVASALSSVQGIDGDKYLEKIVQVPISLPEINIDVIDDYLVNKLNDLISNYRYSMDEDYFDEVFTTCISGKIKTYRDVVRLINALNIKCTLIGRDINIVDLIAITFIEQQESDLFEWIKDNRLFLSHCSENQVNPLTINSSYNEKILADYNELNKTHLGRFEDELMLLFPNWNSGYPSDIRALRLHKRIAHCDFVERYFCFSEYNELSYDPVYNFIFESSLDEMIQYANKIIPNTDKIEKLLTELDSVINELGSERIVLISKVLIRFAGYFENNHREMDYSTFERIIIYIEKLFKLLDALIVFDILIDSINCSDVYMIVSISYLLTNIEYSHGRMGSKWTENTNNIQLINSNQLLICEKAFVARLEHLINSTDIFLYEENGLDRCLFLYSYISKNGFNNFLMKIKKDDIEYLKLASIYAISYKNYRDEIFWRVSGFYKDSITVNHTKHLFDKLVKNISNIKLPYHILIKLTALNELFCGNYSSDEKLFKNDVINKYTRLGLDKLEL